MMVDLVAVPLFLIAHGLPKGSRDRGFPRGLLRHERWRIHLRDASCMTYNAGARMPLGKQCFNGSRDRGLPRGLLRHERWWRIH